MSTKVCLVKAMSSHVWMWDLDYKESWEPKNWCFELWWWGRLLRVPWTSRRSNQSILIWNQSWIFTGRTDAEVEAPVLWLPDAKNWLIWKDPDAGKDWRRETEGDNRGWDGWMASLTQWTWVWVNSRSCWRTGKPGMLQSMRSQRVGHNWVTEQQPPME